MGAVMRYTMQDWKTAYEGRQLVTGINCHPETVYSDFMLTKSLYHKTDGKMFYHMVQSFPKGAEVNPAHAHSAALKLAEHFAGHEILVCTHTERDHIHSHFIINSVNFDTGKKLHMAKEQLQELRQYNDQVCMQFSLPVFVPNPNKRKTKSMTIGEYHLAARGKSKKFQLMAVIQDCMRHAANREAFIALMEIEGYKVRWEQSRKNITYISETGWKCNDDKLIYEKYSKERMEREFQIRAEIITGGTSGTEPARAYTAGHTRTNSNTDNNGTAGSGTPCGDQLDDARVAGAHRETTGRADGAERMADGVPPQDLHAPGRVSDADSNGRASESGEVSGGDSSTGWEKERETFFSAQVQTAQTAPAGMGWPDGGRCADGRDHAGVASSLVLLGRRLEQAQHTAPVSDSTTQHHHADSKTLRKEKQKKIALGQKEDDHEDEQIWQQTM